MADWEAVRADLQRYSQDHLLKFLHELNDVQKAELYGDICEIDFGKIERYFRKAHENFSNCVEKKDESLQPLDSCICGSTARDKVQTQKWEQIGRYMLANYT